MRRRAIRICGFCFVLLAFLFFIANTVSAPSVYARQLHPFNAASSPQVTVTPPIVQPSQKVQPLLPVPFGIITGIFLLIVAVVGGVGITILLTRRRKP